MAGMLNLKHRKATSQIRGALPAQGLQDGEDGCGYLFQSQKGTLSLNVNNQRVAVKVLVPEIKIQASFAADQAIGEA